MISTKEIIELAREKTIVFIGPTAAGKDTLMNKVSRAAGVDILVSHTTRPKREGEIHGVEYWFITEETFMGLPMVEKRHYHVASDDNVWHYGLSEAIGERHGVLVLDWEGYMNFAKWRRANNLPQPISIYVPINKKLARERQKLRGDYHKKEFERRWESDRSWTATAEVRSSYIWNGK